MEDDPSYVAAVWKNPAHRRAEYAFRFDVPPRFQGVPLELFLPDVSCDDRVTVNGRRIGATRLDVGKERPYWSDPLRWTTVPPRFYTIPAGLLKERNNQAVVCLDGTRRTVRHDLTLGFPEQIYLRPFTPAADRRRIRADRRNMDFYTALVNGPQASLRVSVRSQGRHTHAITFRNQGRAPAVFVCLDVEGETSADFVFDEAAFSLPGGEEISVCLESRAGLPAGARLRVIGLNLRQFFVPL